MQGNEAVGTFCRRQSRGVLTAAEMEHDIVLLGVLHNVASGREAVERLKIILLCGEDRLRLREDLPRAGRLIAPTEARIRGVRNRICVASGGYKARALLAVLRSGLPTTVFIDSNLAIRILNLIETDRYEI